MKFKWIAVTALLITGIAAAVPAPASAHVKKKVARACADVPSGPTLGGFFFNPAPRPNGCTPPVYEYGRYVGQDPDPFIRQQLRRDPQTGYTQY
jgi:hypothetical protein